MTQAAPPQVGVTRLHGVLRAGRSSPLVRPRKVPRWRSRSRFPAILV